MKKSERERRRRQENKIVERVHLRLTRWLDNHFVSRAEAMTILDFVASIPNPTLSQRRRIGEFMSKWSGKK